MSEDPKARFGNAKPSTRHIPSTALFALGEAHRLGADKYGSHNWRKTTISAGIYRDAMMRHLLAWWDGEDIDPESGQPHLAHLMASAAIVIDSEHHGVLVDDRPLIEHEEAKTSTRDRYEER